MAASLSFTRKVWQHFLTTKGHDALCYPALKIVDAKPGQVLATLTVKPENGNRLGTAHGGLLLSLVDTLGSLSLSTEGFWLTGPSTDISASFVSGAKIGQEVWIKGSLEGRGKKIAYTRVEVRAAPKAGAGEGTLEEWARSPGALIAFGSHTKYIANVVNHAENVRISADGESFLEKEDQAPTTAKDERVGR